VAVRQGLRYAATRGAIRVLVAAIMVGVLWAAYQLVSDPEANRPRRIQAIAFGMVAVLLVPRGARKLLDWTDRRFFREAYDVERVLTELSEEVRTIGETDPLLDTVLERIGSTLHVDRLAVYLRDGDGFVPSRSRGYPSLPAVTFKPVVENLNAVAASGKAIRVRHDDPESPLRRGALQEPVRAILDELGAELVLPLLGKREVLGFVTLGGKKSEEPYSASDAKLLASVAAQTGLALDNSRLTATIAHEIARRERMSREIEIARDVQLKLFPQRIPVLAGVDCAGACRPAQGVGGDYYDFLALPGGRLGVALGDVAGKGIPAALLMASLQASLRGQRLSGPADLAHMMTNMNRLIFDSSPDNRYATFFYGELDPANRRLDYVNAGHNAPMVFRSSGAIERLRATGPVIGLVDGGRYEQASTALGPGDMLVVYSDGISEAMNAADEEWGEERLSASVRLRRDGAAGALIAHLFESADAFAAGAVQHDDMTLVVVRCE
jgi:sigma-B regulation protein RsbU (phosphoserine phosphatase)